MIKKSTKRLPDFIIVGSMKAGTTSLHHWLMNSGQIAMDSSETHFFNRDYRYEKGPVEYMSLLPNSSCGRLVGDDTPSYSYLPDVPERINKIIPDVKILWILRDPLQRAVSNYWHSARHGIETLSIDEAFLNDINGKTENIWRRYLRRSCYLEQIERYLEHFDRSRMHFIDFKSFINQDQNELNKITKFLGIDSIESHVPHSNEARFYPRICVNRAIMGAKIPYQAKRFIRWSTAYRILNKPSMLPSTRDQANEFVRKNNKGLEKVIGFYPT